MNTETCWRSIALDDPFGDDTNDVDEHGMALLVYEDIYLTIYGTDGPVAAFKLRTGLGTVQAWASSGLLP